MVTLGGRQTLILNIKMRPVNPILIGNESQATCNRFDV